MGFNKKYNVITFQYTLHYMMNNINIVINNLKDILRLY